MLFEILLLVGVTFFPIGLVLTVGDILFDAEGQVLSVGLILVIVGSALLVMSYLLPPIPIIPQG